MSPLETFIRDARILIVDDELANVRLLEANLEEDGQVEFRSTTDSRQALKLFHEMQPDIVLLDLNMPHLDGFGVMEQLKGVIPPEQNLPIVVLTADITPATKARALVAGARDFLTKPFDATELRLRIRNLLELRFLHLSVLQQNESLNARVLARTTELEEALQQLKESQRQAVQQERLHAFSEMAGGVVHDFNNSLAIILGYADILLTGKRLENRASTLDALQIMRTAAQDAAHIVNRLRHFYRPRHEDDCFLPVNLAHLVSEAAKLAKPKWEQAQAAGRTVAIEQEITPVPDVLCNASEMREVMLNLMFNAVDAMADGGVLTLRVQSDENRVVIEVEDTGAGMPEEVRARCLEPFFSTKGESGTGLGLAMVHGIIRRHEGTLEIESTPGVGTTFRLALPYRSGIADCNQEEAVRNQRPLRILYAEDDPALRDIIPLHLVADGHTVELAGNGREALDKMLHQEFDLLVTDLSMPVMNGDALALAVRKEVPGMRIIMLTGFGTMLLADGEKPSSVDLLLSKPITHGDLAAAIARVDA